MKNKIAWKLTANREFSINVATLANTAILPHPKAKLLICLAAQSSSTDQVLCLKID